jgi:CSLREA domain-containing protein
MRRALPLLLPVLILAVAPAGAAVFTVTKTADTLDGLCDPYDCSLREAVTAANKDAATDVIELPAGTYVLTRPGAGEDQSVSGDLDVKAPLILVGRDAGSTVIDGNGADRVLDLRAETEIFGVTIRNGLVDGAGGGVLARAATLSYNVVVRRSVISGNHARGSGGDGGGLLSETSGILAVLESTLSDNRADAKGGGLAGGSFCLIDSTVSGNSAGLLGGGLYFPEELSPPISGSTVTGNQAGQGGGGIYAQAPLFPSSVESNLRGSIVAGNTAPEHPDCFRAFSAGYNVIGVADGCNNNSLDRKGTQAAPLDPGLGPLSTLQGGPTPVHALLPGSPALDLVPAADCTPADQLGQARSALCEAGAVDGPLHPTCLPGGPVLCLQDGRFRVSAYQAGGEPATAAPLTDDTGNFWFFSPQNLELTVKVLDGCGVNDRWWIFSSGLTDRGLELRVEDLYTGKTWTHSRPSGTPYVPRLDTSALDACNPPGAPSSPPVPGALGVDALSAVYVVTKGEDTLDGACDHDCSLREAVTASNARSGVEVILLGPAIHTLSRPGRGEDANVTGDLDVTGHLAILGANGSNTGRAVIDGGGLDRILEDDIVNSSLEIHDVTLRNGRAEVVKDADPGAGGAVNGGDLVLVRCHVTGNRAETYGGGIAADTAIIRDTTVSDNEADFGGGIGFAGVLRATNVTVSGNRARSAGGGLIIDAYDQELANVTITGNSAAAEGGGLYFGSATCPSGICKTDFGMVRSLVAGNSASHGPDCFGLETQNAWNVFGVDDGCSPGPTERSGTLAAPLDPRITALGDHGGPTPTHALLADSPAIDLGPMDGCPARDQRARTRPADGNQDGTALCDSGAVERLPGCQPDATTLCLGAGDRFSVTARWASRGQTGDARSIPLTLDTGAFWFFDPANLELTVKVLDGCGVNSRFWVFVSGLTDVGVEITVEDTLTGESWLYGRQGGSAFPTVTDVNALDVCSAH